MADNPWRFNNSEEVMKQITKEQQTAIRRVYKEASDNIAKKVKALEGRTNISSVLMTQQLNKLQKEIEREITNCTTFIDNTVKESMLKVAETVVGENQGALAKLGLSVDGSFVNVPRDVVRNLISGRVYGEGWKLSKSIWGDNEKKLTDIREIIARGVAENKGSLDIARDLEKYVDPNAKKDWQWNKVYPGSSKVIDYNAQRLARTMVHHAYQQSVVETTKPNPFVTGIRWFSQMGHRTCELCKERATADQFGLGEGTFPKDQVPLDHPNGLCTMAPKVGDMTKAADRIADWALGKSDPEMDKYAKYLYGAEGKDSPVNAAFPAIQKMAEAEKAGKGLISHTDKEIKNLAVLESVSKNKPVEHFSGLNSAGNIVFKNVKGGATSVDISKDDMDMLLNGILTHNHPIQFSGEMVQFSREDLDTALKAQLKEIRAVNKTHVVSFARNQEMSFGETIWGSGKLKSEFMSGFSKPYREGMEGLKKIDRKLSQKELKEFWDGYDKRTDEFLSSKENQKKYGYLWERLKNE